MEIILSPVAVVLGALVSFIIGGLWYSFIFTKPWQKEAGLSDEQLKSGAVRIFVGSFFLSLLMAASLAAFIGNEGFLFGVFAGFAAGLAWVAAALGINYLFERKSLLLWLINAGYNVVTFTAMGAIIGAVQA